MHIPRYYSDVDAFYLVDNNDQHGFIDSDGKVVHSFGDLTQSLLGYALTDYATQHAASSNRVISIHRPYKLYTMRLQFKHVVTTEDYYSVQLSDQTLVKLNGTTWEVEKEYDYDKVYFKDNYVDIINGHQLNRYDEDGKHFLYNHYSLKYRQNINGLLIIIIMTLPTIVFIDNRVYAYINNRSM